ncbi:hypothetical protein F5Y12DRAFT_719531 [Xylaria sp. FL1777]|nr:hypothetical protein F5Y12DRAFT_719531 [Xylaria sp. FL1777]
MDWFAPALMLSAWLGGIIVACGHHVYYSHLNGSPANTNISVLGFVYSTQQLSSALGTSFAFVARAFLVFSSSIAYTQVFWRAAEHPTKPNTLRDLDSMSSSLSNLFAFRRVSIWRKRPVLLFVALVSWLLPVAFVIPPGTLIIALVSNSNSILQHVPNVDFTSFHYLAGMSVYPTVTGDDGNPLYVYGYKGPSIGVEKVAMAVAAQGVILPIDAPAKNASWTLDFYGPSLSCGTMNDTMRGLVDSNIAAWLSNDTRAGSPNCELHASTYLCWTPSVGYDTNPLPFIDDEFSMGSGGTPLYIALLPSIIEDPCMDIENKSTTFLQCDLHNASYHVNFNYKSGIQNIEFEIDRLESVDTVQEVFGPDLWDGSNTTCNQLADIHGPGLGNLCEIDTSLLRRLSYTGILDAFHRPVIGEVSVGEFGLAEVNTNLFATSLVDTPELAYLLNYTKSPQKVSTLQTQFMLHNPSLGGALSNLENTSPRSSLPRVIEEMFSNLTISLMSSNVLQPNLTSPFGPPAVNVTITTIVPVYSYVPANLWIAYGSAILAASLALIAGIVALISNGASYNNDFSSILRAAHGAALSISIKPQDAHGAAPLPKYLESATVSWLTIGGRTRTTHSESKGNRAGNREDNENETLVNYHEGGLNNQLLPRAGEEEGNVEYGGSANVPRD